MPRPPSSDSYPLVLNNQPPEISPLTSESSLNEVVDQDAAIAHFTLQALYAAWQTVSTIDDVCKMTAVTLKTLEMRRRLLNKPMGGAEDRRPAYLMPLE